MVDLLIFWTLSKILPGLQLWVHTYHHFLNLLLAQDSGEGAELQKQQRSSRYCLKLFRRHSPMFKLRYLQEGLPWFKRVWLIPSHSMLTSNYISSNPLNYDQSNPSNPFLGTGGHTKTEEFSEKFRLAFEPPPHFRKIMLHFFFEFHVQKALLDWKWTLPPALELARRFIPFVRATPPLLVSFC